MKIGIFGSGSWGAALSLVLHTNGHQVYLWSNTREEAEKIQKTRRLLHKLPEFSLPEAIQVTHETSRLTEECEILVVAIPSKFIESLSHSIKCSKPKLVVNATKGIHAESLRTMSYMLEDQWNDYVLDIVALSGPTHAEEVAKGMPTAIVAACENQESALQVQHVFQTPSFRVYTNEDRRGVEIGAALKNIIAIAVGISDGLGFGDNARAALIARGMQELCRAGAALGAKQETFFGLSGIGDLVVTCTSRHSRNRKFGELIAKGYSASDAEEEIEMVVEGLASVAAVPKLVRDYRIDLPILQEVYAILIEGSDPKEAVQNLMLRERKAEWE